VTRRPQTIAGQVIYALVQTLPHATGEDFKRRLLA
jgi:hypothetical protein